MKTIVFKNEDLYVIDLKTQYGKNFKGSEFAVISDLEEADIEKGYSQQLKAYTPYVVIGTYYLDVVKDFDRVEDKCNKRNKRSGLVFELDEIASLNYRELQVPDYVTELVEKETDMHEKQCLYRSLGQLTELQRRRLFEKYWNKKSNRAIAEQEGKDIKTINESINSAIKKLKKFFKNTPSKRYSQSIQVRG